MLFFIFTTEADRKTLTQMGRVSNGKKFTLVNLQKCKKHLLTLYYKQVHSITEASPYITEITEVIMVMSTLHRYFSYL